MKHLFSFLILVSSGFTINNYAFSADHKTLELGSKAPDFKLAGC